MKEFLSYLRPYRRDGIIAAFCIVAETVFELVIPLVMASIVDVGVANGDRHYILAKGAQMIFFALIALVLGQGSAIFTARFGQGLGAQLRQAEFARLQEFSFANTDHFSASSLVTRLTGDVTTIQNAVATGMRPGLRSPIMMITAMTASFLINPQLALVFLVAAPILAVMLFFIISHVRPLYSRMQGAIDQVNRIIQENLTAIRVVKSYVRGDYETEKFDHVNTAAHRLRAGIPAGCLKYARHAVCDVRHHPGDPVVRRKYPYHRRHRRRGTYGILKLCASGVKLPDDVF